MKPRRPDDREGCEAIGSIVATRIEVAFPGLGLPGSAPKIAAKIGRFATILALWGTKINLTADPTDHDETTFHVLDSLAPAWLAAMHPETPLGRSFGKGRRMLDVGSGAGFPGLILAAVTGIDTVLVESRRKRANFLRAAAATMGLPRVTVIHSWATPADIPSGFDLITARAVGRHREFFELAAAALKPGGIAMLYLSMEQPIDGEAALACGLVELPCMQYEVSRGEDTLRRVLGLWLKATSA
ncbi:MAG TPA: 16S rRNA (guanine(527)-N(7))-methyltransferase RsmG [Candidatus Binataceae bacterium]|nr:16S rRNA (guanine(527)-N(7))-methyltransferase RsmG [Candidatus Binataceae bacterium]